MYLIANWKLNKTVENLEPWLKEVISEITELRSHHNKKIIIAASDVLLTTLSKLINKSAKARKLGISIAAQDVSVYVSGPHTGETSVLQIKDIVDYCIIGHSERRAMGESDKDIYHKAKNLIEHDIQPIICFSQLIEIRNLVSYDLDIDKCLFAYEPLYAIGTGNEAPAAEIQRVYNRSGLKNMIYGGSVNSDILEHYVGLDFLNGYLVGSASLDPKSFSQIYRFPFQA